MSIQSLAASLYTVPNTITRLCKKLGYDGYSHLKNSLKEELHTELKGQDMVENSLYTTVQKTFDLMDMDKIKLVTRLLREAKNILFFGVGDSVIFCLLKRIPVKPGDFFYVPSGTIHALCEGTIVLETQQSSDTTYRLYDYDRKDQNGNTRELHVDKAIDVIAVPHKSSSFEPVIEKREGGTITTFVKGKYFTVYKWEIKEKTDFTHDKQFLLISIIQGDGKLTVGEETYKIKKGDHLIMPSGTGDFTIEGMLEAIVSHP